MKFAVLYEESVVKNDIPKLPKRERSRIKRAIDQKLTTEPQTFGKPLRRSLKGYRSLRVGNYRVIYRIEETTIKIFAIQHRSSVYNRK